MDICEYTISGRENANTRCEGIICDVTWGTARTPGSWTRKNKWKWLGSGQRAKGGVWMGPQGKWREGLWLASECDCSRYWTIGAWGKELGHTGYFWLLSFPSATPAFWTCSKDSESWSFLLFLFIYLLSTDGEDMVKVKGSGERSNNLSVDSLLYCTF